MAYVIGVAAQAQMGKDTLADRLQERLNAQHNNQVDMWHESQLGTSVEEQEAQEYSPEYNPWTRAAFASNVKRVFQETFGVDKEFTEKWKVRPEENPPGFDMSVRSALQFIGDGFRQIRGTIWLDLCFRDDVPKIISDVRYVNEFTRVKNEGGLNILVGRPEKLNDDPNGSEAQIRPYCEWALKHFQDEEKKMFCIKDGYSQSDNPPPQLHLFDVFIRNDGTKEELYEVIDKQLVPFVNNFVFDFPTNKEDTECLISN